jgi:PAS domain S-box-containing protein
LGATLRVHLAHDLPEVGRSRDTEKHIGVSVSLAQSGNSQALQEAEERMSFVLRATQEGVWDWNLETDAVWYSPRYKEMLGYAEDEIEPHVSAWRRLLHPDDRAHAQEVVDAVMRGAQEYKMEFRLRHKDGHYVDIFSRGFPVRREPGDQVIRIVGTHLDLTERKQAEKQLRESEQRFRVAREMSLDAFTILDAVRDESGAIVDFRWVYVNPVAGRLLRHAPEALVGQSQLDRIIQAIKDGKLDDAQKLLTGLEAKKGSLPASSQDRVAAARKSLDAARFAESAKSALPKSTPKNP